MKMRNTLFIFLVVTVTVIGFWFFLTGDSERMNANRIISKIEEYRLQEGRLPDPENHSLMLSLGFDLRVGWHPDYEPLDATYYRITILEGMDGPYWFYESKSHEWHQGYPTKTAKAEKTDAGIGSYGSCRVIGASRSPSPNPGRSTEGQAPS